MVEPIIQEYFEHGDTEDVAVSQFTFFEEIVWSTRVQVYVQL